MFLYISSCFFSLLVNTLISFISTSFFEINFVLKILSSFLSQAFQLILYLSVVSLLKLIFKKLFSPHRFHFIFKSALNSQLSHSTMLIFLNLLLTAISLKLSIFSKIVKNPFSIIFSFFRAFSSLSPLKEFNHQ